MAKDSSAAPAPANRTFGVGDIIPAALPITGSPVRPFIITSLNADGTANGRFVLDPDDNPQRDGNFPSTARNVKV